MERIGEQEVDDPANNRIAREQAEQVYRTLLEAGVATSGVRFDIVPGGRHHETTWQMLFPSAISWLSGNGGFDDPCSANRADT
ncbi:hypothetical protein ACFFSY_26230 [Paenibacillus aurantiacus]|uniref:Uncharacterized protein n=1 Tax=Paenibacillus aurantiacus TaxID=1936118 RepID=A0ABV5KW59_9BACL